MQECLSFQMRPYRLDGLGHRAFNAATRVRIPLGTPKINRNAKPPLLLVLKLHLNYNQMICHLMT